MSFNPFSRRQFINTLSAGAFASMILNKFPVYGRDELTDDTHDNDTAKMKWQAGLGKRIITPENGVWLAGFGMKREADSKFHDLYVKVLALKSAYGKRVVMATSDNQGMSKTIYERLYKKVHDRFKLDRSEFMLTFSHNHSGPCLEDDLVDYYPSDDDQRRKVKEYTLWMEDQVIAAIGEALSSWQPAGLYHGEGKCTFAVNRRDNVEAEVPKLLAEGKLKGVIDHYVPVLSIKGKDDKLLGVLFGYACHPTTLSFNTWSGDYPGFAQINLEEKYPGTSAMFFNACGGDQNPLPRRQLELCKKYGKMLSDAVAEVLSKPMKPISSDLKTAFKHVNLDYEEVATRETLKPVAEGTEELQARWAKRMLAKLDKGEVFPAYYSYPVQAWKFGKELLLIGIGGEAVVDYSLRFKREFNQQATWVCGYANEMAAYIPSRRVWEERGYEGGSHLDEYGRPAWRWAGDVEDRIAGAVHDVVAVVQKK